MASWANASYLRKLTDMQFKGTALGSINDVGHCLDDSTALWLISNAESSGVSVAEWLSGIVKDAYWEDSNQ